MKRYIYQPGNNTRYDLYLGKTEDNRWLISWMYRGGSGGKSFAFTDHVHYTYLEEKLEVNHADAAAILAFIRDNTSLTITMPPRYNKQGLHNVYNLTT